MDQQGTEIRKLSRMKQKELGDNTSNGQIHNSAEEAWRRKKYYPNCFKT